MGPDRVTAFIKSTRESIETAADDLRLIFRVAASDPRRKMILEVDPLSVELRGLLLYGNPTSIERQSLQDSLRARKRILLIAPNPEELMTQAYREMEKEELDELLRSALENTVAIP